MLNRFSISALLCLVAGGFSALAMAPLNLWFALFVTLGVLYACVARAENKKQSFAYGWLFGFGYFLVGLFWIKNALLVEGNPYAWAWPLAVCGLPFLLAFFYGFATLFAARISNLKTISGYVAFAASLALFEWLRGHIFTGFPWNLMGYSWIEILPVIQITSVGSIYTLTWLTILWGGVGGFIFVQDGGFKSRIILPVIFLVSFAGVYGYGAQRLSNYTPTYHDNVNIKIIQPNIAQHEKWDGTKMAAHFFKHIRLSYPDDAADKFTYIIWPETALSYLYAQDKTSMGVLGQMLSSYDQGAVLITGMLRRLPDVAGYANSIVMIDENGIISNAYDKSHLVPFGEYIPFQKWIPLETVSRFSGFIEGTGPQSFEAPQSLRYSPLICYESIFSGKAISPREDAPDFIVNATNDGWYGFSAAPHQHFTQTIFRAVEEGVPLVRSANTGISGLIGPMGRIIAKTGLFTDASDTVPLPKKLVSEPKSATIKAFIFMLLIAASLSVQAINRFLKNV